MTHPPRRRRGAPLHHEPQAVTYAREKAGLTKKEAADLAGISPQLMGAIEKGERDATPANLKELARVFNCPIVVLERKREPITVPAQRSDEEGAA